MEVLVSSFLGSDGCQCDVSLVPALVFFVGKKLLSWICGKTKQTSVCLSACVRASVSPSLCLSLSACLSVPFFVCVCVYQSVFLVVCLYIYRSFSLEGFMLQDSN